MSAQLRDVLANTQPQLLSLGGLLALVAATAGTSSMTKAMNRAYEVHDQRPLVQRIVLAAALTVIAGVAIVTAFVVVVGGTLATHNFIDQAGLGQVWPWMTLLRWPAAFALLVLAVTVLLRFTPDFRTPWRWAAVAATAFAVVWLGATYAFAVYVARYAELRRDVRGARRRGDPDVVVLPEFVRAHLRGRTRGIAGANSLAAPAHGALGYR